MAYLKGKNTFKYLIAASNRKNATDTAITLTLAANATAGLYSDLTHSFTVAAGDLIDIKLVNNATANGASVIYFAYTL